MVMKTTTWRPDTCGCELHYDWDTDHHEDIRVHTPREVHPHGHVTKRCPKHSHHVSVHDLHAAVLAENRAKNMAVIGTA